MRVCLDTNVMLRMFGLQQVCYPIWREFLRGKIELAVSNEILLEYEEIISLRSGAARWQAIHRALELAAYVHRNVLFIEPHFRFRAIAADADDNKFADCAIAAQADYIVTDDNHFDALHQAGYKPRPIPPAEFIQRYCQPN